VPMALCGAAVAVAALGWFARVVPIAPLTRSALIAGFAAGLVAYRVPRYEAPVVRVHPDLAAAIERAEGLVPDGDVIVTPERHLVFMAAWYTRREVRLDPRTVERARRWRLVPMAYMSPGLVGAIDRVRANGATIESLHTGNIDGVVLMREPVWDAVLGELDGPERDFYARWPTH
jgi:hypothetical protein